MSEEFTFLYRKPYRFVPLSEEQPERAKPAGHATLSPKLYTGTLRIGLTALTPLHVRAGDGIVVAGRNGGTMSAYVRANGRLTIPGSSLRGVVRSISESASRSCGPTPPGRHNDHDFFRGGMPKTSADPCPDAQNRLCPTCRMFGYVNARSHYRSQVTFSDLGLTTGTVGEQIIPRLQTPFRSYPRGARGNERLYYCALYQAPAAGCRPTDCPTCTKNEYFERLARVGQQRHIRMRGRKFYCHGRIVRPAVDARGNRVGIWLEVALPGSRFEGEVRFINLTQAELQLLAFSLGLGDVIQLKVGYGKPVFLGSVRTDLLSAQLRCGPKPETPLTDWISGLAQSHGGAQVPAIRTVLSWQNVWAGIEPPDAPKNAPPARIPQVY